MDMSQQSSYNDSQLSIPHNCEIEQIGNFLSSITPHNSTEINQHQQRSRYNNNHPHQRGSSHPHDGNMSGPNSQQRPDNINVDRYHTYHSNSNSNMKPQDDTYMSNSNISSRMRNSQVDQFVPPHPTTRPHVQPQQQQQFSLSAERKTKLRSLFFQAIENGDRNATMAMYLKAKSLYPTFDLINSPNDKGICPLLVAANAGRYQIVLLLTELGAHVQNCDIRGWNALYYACYQGHTAIATFLLYLHPTLILTSSDLQSKTPLTIASSRGHFKIVQLCITYGVDVDSVTETGETALICAAKYGHYSIVQYLVACGASLDSRDQSTGQTALLYACRNQRYDIAEYLIARGACIDVLDNNGNGITQFSAVQLDQFHSHFYNQPTSPSPTHPHRLHHYQPPLSQRDSAQHMKQRFHPSNSNPHHIISAQHRSNDGSNTHVDHGMQRDDYVIINAHDQDFLPPGTEHDDLQTFINDHRENVIKCIQNGTDRRVHAISTLLNTSHYQTQQLQTQLMEATHFVMSKR